VELRVERVATREFGEETLREAESVIAFSVKDTGSGIPPQKLSVIFEAFQQSDGTTNRKYGGTGLGLSISREIAALLGGRIDVESEQGVGSRFTLFIPALYPGGAPAPEQGVVSATGTPSLTGPDTDAGELTPPPVPAALPEVARPAVAEPGPGRPGPTGTAERAEPDGSTPAAWPESGGREETTAPETPARREETSSLEWPAAAEPRGAGGDGSRDETWPETTQLKRWLSGKQGPVLSGSNVLIVDDDIRNVFALTHVLGRVGISVKYAENGREGLDVLDRSPEVSIVLMDIMMPEMNGYEAIRTIRNTPRLAGLPVIALTAKAMSGDSQKALDSGADVYVAKPVDVDELLGAMYNLLLESNGDSPQAASGEGPPPPPDPAPRADAQGAASPDGSAPGEHPGDHPSDDAHEPPGRSA
ncbi:MAG TPA: response regulator, partial [Streptomyces sp.]|jgi:CheY-like chemotaxis protein|nr:response regulator [Streptomyces sp.]